MSDSYGRQLNALFGLILINLALYLLDHWLHLGLIKSFYLNHAHPQWYQFITSMFCHANWAHLSGNLFFLYIFGKMIEEERGPWILLLCYLLCGLGANALSYVLLSSNTVSLGASGAVFGLFTAVVGLKIERNWRKIIELVILGQFVIMQVLNETQNIGSNDGINRVAHLGGALFGAVVIIALARLNKAAKTLIS